MSTLALRAVPAAATPVAATPAAGVGLVLTPRGRRVVRTAAWAAATALVALGVLLLWLSVASVVAPGASAGDGGEGVRSGASASSAALETTTVVVRPGDTLWQIARTYSPGRDPRSVTDEIVGLNGLTSTAVQVGATLQVPTT